VTIGIWSLLLWNYFNGGIPSHHLLAREDLPSFSNAWGGLLLPALTWFLVYRIQTRKDEKTHSSGIATSAIFGFLGALLFGTTLSVFFVLGTDVPSYLIRSVFLIAFFLPIYRAEYLLGFVLGMTFTFGAVLPTLVGSILAMICALIYLILRRGLLVGWKKIAGA